MWLLNLDLLDQQEKANRDTIERPESQFVKSASFCVKVFLNQDLIRLEGIIEILRS